MTLNLRRLAIGVSISCVALLGVGTAAAQTATPEVSTPGNEIGGLVTDGMHRVWREANDSLFGDTIRYHNTATNEQRLLAAGKWYLNPVLKNAQIAWFESSGACDRVPFRLCTPVKGTWDLVTYNADSQHMETVVRDVDSPAELVATDGAIHWKYRANGSVQSRSYDLKTGQPASTTLGSSIPTSAIEEFPPIGLATSTSGVAPATTTTPGTPVPPSATTTPPVTLTPPRDTDRDGIPDLTEIILTQTNWLAFDSDGDKISDYRELYLHHTDPMSFDSDVDGIDDMREIDLGVNPTTEGTPDFTFFEWTAPPRGPLP